MYQTSFLIGVMGEDPEIDWAGEGDKEWMESGDNMGMGELIGDVVRKRLQAGNSS